MRWSIRKFVAAAVGPIGVCALASLALLPVSSRPTPRPADKLEILRWLHEADFARLDRTLNRFQSEFEQGERPEWHVQHAFQAFANTDPAVEPRIDQWLDTYPDSFAPWLARGVQMLHRAWLNRSELVGREVHPEQFRGMRHYGEQAIPALRAAIERRPNLTEAYAQLIFMLNGLASREEAMQVLRQGLDAVSDSARLHGAHLWMLQPQWGGDLAQMASAIDQINRDSPSEEDMQALRGEMHVTIAGAMARSRDPAGALRYLEDARQLGSHVDVFEAGLLVDLGRPAEALLAYGRALERWPQDVEAHRGIANLLSTTPAAAAFRRHLDLLLTLDGLHPIVLTLRAGHLARAGQHEAAARDYEDALIYGAYNRHVLAVAGEFLSRIPAKQTIAITALDRVLEMSPEDVSLRQWVSAALRRLDDCDLLPKLDDLLAEYIRLCARAECRLFEFNRTGWATANDRFREQCANRSLPLAEPGAP